MYKKEVFLNFEKQSDRRQFVSVILLLSLEIILFNSLYSTFSSVVFFLKTPYSLVLLSKNPHSLDTISLFLSLLHF